MAKVISPENFTKAIMEELELYGDQTAEAIETAVKATAKDAVSELKTSSPKKTGSYAASWTHSKLKGTEGKSYSEVVYAKSPHYRLTHLLEKGHRLVRKGKVCGTVKAYPHIAKAEQNAINALEKRLKEEL